MFKVWDARSNALITFNHDNFSGDVACIADNDVISELLFREAESAENVEMRNLAKIAECKLPASSKEKSQVTLENSETFSCDLLVSDLLLGLKEIKNTSLIDLRLVLMEPIRLLGRKWMWIM